MSAVPFDFHLPTRIACGVGALERLGDLARELVPVARWSSATVAWSRRDTRSADWMR